MSIPTDPSAAYVNTLSNSKYQSQVADTASFDALKEMYMVYVNADTNYFPEKKQVHALALLVCHHYAMNTDTIPQDSGSSDQQTGSIASESVGDVSISYGGMPSMGSVDGWKAWLAQSKYGSEYLYLMKTFRPSPLVL